MEPTENEKQRAGAPSGLNVGLGAKRTATNCQHIVFPPNGSKISSVRCGERHCLPDDICGSFCQNECEFYKAPNY